MSVVTIENAELAYDAHDHESTQAQYAGRLKFACCRQCGSADGMQPVHRETLTVMTDYKIEVLASWYRYRESLTDGYLYYPCPHCNWQTVIPDDFIPVPTGDVLTKWRITDPMAPDYAALAAEEPVLASIDSRQSAGI